MSMTLLDRGECAHWMSAQEDPRVAVPARRSRWSRWLSHPFVLLLAGAAFTSVFGPYLAQRWQDRQASLSNQRAQVALKTKLVGQIATLTTSEVGFIEDDFTTRSGLPVPALRQLRASTRRRWRQESAGIEVELRSWFPDSRMPQMSIGDTWVALQDEMLEFEGIAASIGTPEQNYPLSFVRLMFEKNGRLRPNHFAISEFTTGIQQAYVFGIREFEHLRSERLSDPFRRKNSALDHSWTRLRKQHVFGLGNPNRPLDLLQRVREGTATGSAFYSIAVGEFDDARERLVRQLLASKASGF